MLERIDLGSTSTSITVNHSLDAYEELTPLNTSSATDNTVLENQTVDFWDEEYLKTFETENTSEAEWALFEEELNARLS